MRWPLTTLAFPGPGALSFPTRLLLAMMASLLLVLGCPVGPALASHDKHQKSKDQDGAQGKDPKDPKDDREAPGGAVINRETRSVAVINRETRSVAVINRETRSVAVIDRKAKKARDLAVSAQALKDRGAAAEALNLFQQAYAVKPLPIFLYESALCHKMMGNAGRAAFSLRQYLRQATDIPDRGEVDEMAHEMEVLATTVRDAALPIGRQPGPAVGAVAADPAQTPAPPPPAQPDPR